MAADVGAAIALEPLKGGIIAPSKMLDGMMQDVGIAVDKIKEVRNPNLSSASESVGEMRRTCSSRGGLKYFVMATDTQTDDARA